jgi:eukaryotic-like serine/threonine-protein kinase
MTEPTQNEDVPTTLRRTQSEFDSSNSFAPGTILIDRFIVEEHIGRGGMGNVYRARDLHMQGEPAIAVKVLSDELRTNPDAIAALQRECRKARMLAHDAIVRVFEFHTDGFHNFITMELLVGESLEAVVNRHPSGLGIERAFAVLEASGSALTYAHRQEPPFIHSDFKPSNLFLTSAGRTKVLDFGVARAARSASGTTVATLFDSRRLSALTPAYASCEMLAGLDPDPRDDVYAFACVAYVLLTGTHPFGSRPADQARSLQLAPKSIAHLSRSQNRAIARGLAFEREERTPTIDELLAELSHVDRPKVPSAVLRVAAAVALAVAIALVVSQFFTVSRDPQRPEAVASQSAATVDSQTAPVRSEAVLAKQGPSIDAEYVQGLAAEAQRTVCDRLDTNWETFSCKARKACYQLRAGWDSEIAAGLGSVNPSMAQMLTYKSKLNEGIAAAACEDMAAARDRAQAEMESRFSTD